MCVIVVTVVVDEVREIVVDVSEVNVLVSVWVLVSEVTVIVDCVVVDDVVGHVSQVTGQRIVPWVSEQSTLLQLGGSGKP